MTIRLLTNFFLLAALGFALPAQSPDQMRWYVLVLLEKGAHTDQPKAEAARIQDGHMANMQRLHKEGKLILAGPVAEGGDTRGIFLLNTGSLDEAREWCAGDPAVKAGRDTCRLMRWYSMKGIGIQPEK